ncbi:polynucleotide kinase [Pseudomonas phage PspYZU05]|uniref:Polynucleotide kinase PNKP phosphatase domain-containing protein n=1 Tax=Pseudomonas phage PspYZU05 TaxID=1983556 RepID=A0A2U7NBZ0_9CAUD|nr:polynucleotide kinase [Pseudomonas phage PspYZU05]ASD52169.1 hypothetical protein PspYZU05_217 [Pseudomonas phage PspYZU05]
MKLILTIGAPGSGKSTWASENRASLNAVVLSRDDIRCALFQCKRHEYKYTKEREKTVSALQFSMAEAAIKANQNVIIADTNLNPATVKLWEAFAKEHGIFIEFKRFDVTWSTLLERNIHRGENAVPLSVLRSFYKMMNPREYVQLDHLEKAIIVDLDGTLAIHNGRSPYDFSRCYEDLVNQEVLDIILMYKARGYKIITLSGRESGNKDNPTIYRDLTIKWIEDKAGFTPDLHLQRAYGDSRKDYVVKEELFFDNIADNYNVVLSLDDRTCVVEMWRRIGLKCFQVDNGDF